MADPADSVLETHIREWRRYAVRRRELFPADVDELEEHLRDEVDMLSAAGLSGDEAFLVAVKRMGALDAISREFAREHSERLWKQLMFAGDAGEGVEASSRFEPIVAIACACAAAGTFKLPQLLGGPVFPHPDHTGFYARNISLFVLPWLTVFFAWKRNLASPALQRLAAVFALAVALANAYPFRPSGSTEVLTALHLPIALWFVVGLAYTGDRWGDRRRRMDFVRFTGELVIYYALIAFGGIVLTGSGLMLFQAIGVPAVVLFRDWVVPSGACGAVIIGAWLVEAKQSVIENMAPVLTTIFTPLFAVLLLGFLATMAATGSGVDVGRDVLIGFDLLLVVVVGLVLYAMSARDPQAPPAGFDVLQLVLIVSALLADLVALAAIAARITEFGFSPNKVAALGENLILFVNLAWSGWLYLGFIRRRTEFAVLERWHTDYLPVYAVWAAIVVVFFPVVFAWR